MSSWFRVGSSSSQSRSLAARPAGTAAQVEPVGASGSPQPSRSPSAQVDTYASPSSGPAAQSLSLPSQRSGLPGNTSGSRSSQSLQVVTRSRSTSTASTVVASQSSSTPLHPSSTSPGFTRAVVS